MGEIKGQMVDDFAMTEMVIRLFVQNDFCKEYCPQGQDCASQREFFGRVYAWVVISRIGTTGAIKKILDELKHDIDKEFTCPYNAERLAYDN